MGQDSHCAHSAALSASVYGHTRVQISGNKEEKGPIDILINTFIHLFFYLLNLNVPLSITCQRLSAQQCSGWDYMI